MAMGKGLYWNLIKDFPIIKSTHVNVRYAETCSSLFNIICLFPINTKKNHRSKIVVSFIIISTTLASMASYQSIIDQKNHKIII